MLEWWKPVVGYEGLYQVSSQGRVRRVDGRVLKPYPTPYPRVNLCKDGKPTTWYIHQLIVDAFRPGERLPGLEVNHKDENKQNSVLSNLEVVTHQGNAQHSAKLTADQVAYIRVVYVPRKVTRIWLAQKFGVTVSCIKSVLNHKNWPVDKPNPM